MTNVIDRPRRRKKGTGTIERMPDGSWRPRLPSGDRERLRACPTWNAAAELLDAALAEIASGDAVAVGGQKLRGFGEEWLDQRELAGLRGIRTDRSRWKQHIQRAGFIDWPLAAVSRADVRSWLADLLKKRAAPGRGQAKPEPRKLSRITVQNTLNLLRVCFQSAVEQELLVTNPCAGVRLPRSPGRTHEPWTYLPPAEQLAMVGAEQLGPDDRLLVAFCMGTGLRQGEAWNLELPDLRIEDRVVVVRFGSKGQPPKNGKIRRVPLFGIALEAAEAWLPILKTRPNPARLAWPLPSGARRQKGKTPRGWQEALEKAGLVPEKRHDGRPVRWHDLRHTCASSLVAGWWGRRWSLQEVKELLGHSSVTTTERYAHLADSALDAAARETDASRMRPANTVDLAKTLAPPRRLERPTNGLGSSVQIEQATELERLRGLIQDLSAQGIEGLKAIAAGGPGAWRVVEEVLRDVAVAGDAFGQKEGRNVG